MPQVIIFGKHVPQIRLPESLSVSPERAAASAALLGTHDDAGARAAMGGFATV